MRVPMKFVTIFADFADERCKIPTKYVTKFMDMPITHILSDSSVPGIKRRTKHVSLAYHLTSYRITLKYQTLFQNQFTAVTSIVAEYDTKPISLSIISNFICKFYENPGSVPACVYLQTCIVAWYIDYLR